MILCEYDSNCESQKHLPRTETQRKKDTLLTALTVHEKV